jgi:hypothetical protein
MSANYAHCHSERSEESNPAQDKLREESRRPFPFVSLRVRVTFEAPERLRLFRPIGG